MKVTSTSHDEVSALLTVTLNKSDYKDKVEKTLINYAKSAQIPGFRKGKAPLSMIRKQYEQGLAFEEVNKQVSDALNQYINENKLRLVGQPVPVPMTDLDFNAEELSVGFEVGYEPDFTIDLSKYSADYFSVEASDKEVTQSVENMQKRFAEKQPLDEATEDAYFDLEIQQIVEEDAEGEHHHHPKTAAVNSDKTAAYELVKGLKKDESVKITKTQLLENEDLAKELGFAKEEAEHLHHDELEITVKDIYNLQLAELNQELFDKVYGEGNIDSEEALKNRVKTELDEYFQQNAEVHYFNNVLKQIIEKEEVKLPEDFLAKWLMFSNEEINSEEQAKEILQNEKEQLKYQIIEGKLLSENEVNIDYNEVLEQAQTMVRNQLAMYGIHNLPEDEVQKYAVEMLKDQEQVRQISSEVAMAKLKNVVLEKAGRNEKTISHDEFLEEIKK